MAAHFATLTFLVSVVGVHSAGLANLGAALVGISVSFLGNRYFVFRSYNEPIFEQAAKFAGLYAATGAVHGLTLFLWSDVWAFDYRFGFLIATGIQVVLSFYGNKNLVFK